MGLIFSGKVAMVTGGARGIGRATVLKLAKAGCDVAIVYYNSSDEADELVQTVENLGQKAYAFKANVADEASVKALFSDFKTHFSKLDFLISNAASGVLKPAMKMSTKHWRWCLETNALALNHLVKEAESLMPKGSRVIALSSLGGKPRHSQLCLHRCLKSSIGIVGPRFKFRVGRLGY